MPKLTFVVVLLLSGTILKAQQSSISGKVNDTLNKTQLHRAVVHLLRAKDSVLVRFVRTAADGSFAINNVDSGKYIVLVSFPSYADFVTDLSLDGTSAKEMGNLTVIKSASLLADVLVKQKIAAIRIKGDTTEYKADSFNVGPNANVQELLKKLPGLQVNSKGEITAQGQKVQKVLVDGEEFFSDDPAVVTQNLRSDAVDKVQVFDKKSDQATFTGIDDGEKIKTINLELKEDAKKGYFGKVEVGSDFDRFRKGRAMINAFKGKQKIAAFVTNDNSRFESLNWEERSQFGEDLNRTTEVQDDGSTWTTSSGDYFSNGQGFPNQTTGGLLFSKKWAQDKQNFNGTYQFNQLNVTGGRTGFEKTILPQGDTSFTNSYTTNFDNQAHRSRAKLVHEWTIDSSSSLKATINGSYNKNQSFEANQNNTINEGNRKLNEASRTLSNDESKTTVAANVFYRKRFKKKGRTISLSVDVEKTDIKSDGFLKANNIFYTINQPAFVLPTDQNKTNVEDRLSYKAKAVYTEPLGKDYFLESNVLYSRGNNEANRTTLEKLPGGVKYENRIDTLSNFFSFNTRNVQGGASIKYNGKKFQWSLGTDLGSVRFAQDDRLRNFTRSLSFTNFLPRASVKFIRNKQSSVNLTYNGSTQNPTLNNVQPIINNIDPLNITVGNPDLQQEFRHNFNVNFNDYKVLKNRSIWLGGGLTLTDNAIANASFIDSSGKRINKAVNVDGNFSMWMWSNYGFDLFEGINFGFTFSPNINRNVNFVNGKRNTTTNYQWRFGIQTSYWGDKIYNFWINIEPAYNIASSTINPTDVKYWSLNSYPNFGLKFKKLKLYLDLEGEMRWFQKAGAFAVGRDVYQLNASIKKTFLKKEELELKLYINDVFNQAQGVDRSISSNFISEDVSQVIQRFFMFSLTWNFNHSNAQAAK